MELRIAQYMGLRKPVVTKSGDLYYFQNYWLNKSAKLTIPFGGSEIEQPHEFLPFGFSGIATDRQGDLKEANLVVPNNELTRGWIDLIVRDRWFVTVRTIIPENDTTPSAAKSQILFTYIGVITTASWDETVVTATVSSVLDAVGTDTPTRRITRQIVGSIPTTSNVQLQ